MHSQISRLDSNGNLWLLLWHTKFDKQSISMHQTLDFNKKIKKSLLSKWTWKFWQTDSKFGQLAAHIDTSIFSFRKPKIIDATIFFTFYTIRWAAWPELGRRLSNFFTSKCIRKSFENPWKMQNFLKVLRTVCQNFEPLPSLDSSTENTFGFWYAASQGCRCTFCHQKTVSCPYFPVLMYPLISS